MKVDLNPFTVTVHLLYQIGIYRISGRTTTGILTGEVNSEVLYILPEQDFGLGIKPDQRAEISFNGDREFEHFKINEDIVTYQFSVFVKNVITLTGTGYVLAMEYHKI